MWSTPEARLAATKKRTLSGESLIVVAVNSMAVTLADAALPASVRQPRIGAASCVNFARCRPPPTEAPKRLPCRRLPAVVGSMVVLALAAPVVASVMAPEVTDGPRPGAAAGLRRPCHRRGLGRPPRPTAAASPDRLLRQQRADALARRRPARRRARRERRAGPPGAAARARRGARRPARGRPRAPRAGRPRSRSGSARFNVLGSQHTAPGGDRQKLPAGVDPHRRRGRPDRPSTASTSSAPRSCRPTSCRDLQNRTGMAA